MIYIIKWWQRYKTYVAKVTMGNIETISKDIDYWRNMLFKNFMMYSLPVSLIALAPAIPMGLMAGDGYLIGFDICIVVAIGYIGLNPKISLILRKSIVSLLIYLYAVVTIANLGSFGPGVLYLLATTVFTTLILSTRLGYISVLLHLLESIGFAVVIHAKLFATPLIQQYTLGSWIAFSSNLIFLGIICVVLVGKTIDGLEGTIIQELKLQAKQKEHIKAIEAQNQTLQNIAYIQSHVVRAPLARIMGLVNLLKLNKNDKPDPEVLQHLESSAQDLDSTIQNITDHTGLFDHKAT